MGKIKIGIGLFVGKIIQFGESYNWYQEKKKYVNVHPSAFLGKPSACNSPAKIYMEENTILYANSIFIIRNNDVTQKGKFIMRKGATAAEGLVVVTNEHTIKPPINMLLKDALKQRIGDWDVDIVIDEQAWIGANVTLLPGAYVGRSAIVGGGSVVRRKVPPYAIVTGNPAKIVGFVFNPTEMEEYEKKLYPEDKRISVEHYKKLYEKYYYNRLGEISKYISL